ncbi:uncharacterized protein LOC123566259 [Mercenaria mercenaria]|uniref:uncharacterized protein LOC123566259 n=1 Tax=Mercenaria mercenaria TaxID=6596 RepID=UPI00234F7B4D|nr:uncharacterized protein LOC123566259 [Mercenaria mercenaria]
MGLSPTTIKCQRLSDKYVCMGLLTVMMIFSLFLLLRDNMTDKEKLSPDEIQNQFEIKAFNTKYINKTSGDVMFDYKSAMSALNAAKVSADDPLLLGLIRRYYIENPSDLGYNLENPHIRDTSKGQAAFVDEALNHTEKGFYVECGAQSGEFLSNSLFFERFRSWSGILIEANPMWYKVLKNKHRKAFTINACLSTKPYPSMVKYGRRRIIGDDVIKPDLLEYDEGPYIDVQCFPLHSILLALNQVKVDYFSLDVEGAEKPILDTIPWDKVDIKMMSIEYNKWIGGEKSLKTYMQNKHYKFLTSLTERHVADIIVQKI